MAVHARRETVQGLGFLAGRLGDPGRAGENQRVGARARAASAVATIASAEVAVSGASWWTSAAWTSAAFAARQCAHARRSPAFHMLHPTHTHGWCTPTAGSAVRVLNTKPLH